MLTYIFRTNNCEEATAKANQWLDLEENLDINVVSVETRPYHLHDLFHHDGTICNQWIEYITTILYNYEKNARNSQH